MFTSVGTIIYDPFRGGMKRRTNWWAVANVDREITRYYRWWVKKRFWVDLHQPSWDAHVSIIRGERPSNELKHLWKKYHKQKIEFQYSHNVWNGGKNNNYWFVDIESPELIDIRRELKLPCNWKLHLTIGRTWER